MRKQKLVSKKLLSDYQIIRIWDGHWEQRDSEMIARGSRYWKQFGNGMGRVQLVGANEQ